MAGLTGLRRGRRGIPDGTTAVDCPEMTSFYGLPLTPCLVVDKGRPWGRGGLSPPPISVEMASFRQKSGASGHGQLQSEVGGEALLLEVEDRSGGFKATGDFWIECGDVGAVGRLRIRGRSWQG